MGRGKKLSKVEVSSFMFVLASYHQGWRWLWSGAWSSLHRTYPIRFLWRCYEGLFQPVRNSKSHPCVQKPQGERGWVRLILLPYDGWGASGLTLPIPLVNVNGRCVGGRQREWESIMNERSRACDMWKLSPPPSCWWGCGVSEASGLGFLFVLNPRV